MDTNSDNYSHTEIIEVLKLTDEDLKTKESVLKKTETLVNKIKHSESLDDERKNEYIAFFWNCFQKLNETHRYEISRPSLYPASLPKNLPESLSLNTHNTEYIRGDVNPIKRETIKNTLIVSNKFSKGKSSCDFSVALNEPLTNVVSLKVAALEIVNFYYNISKNYKNTYFHIETYIQHTVTGEISNKYRKKIELPDGYYNLQKFINIVESILNADEQVSMIEFLYDELKGKVYFVFKDELPVPPPEDSEYRFELDFSTECDIKFMGIGWMLGYRAQFYTYVNDYVKEKVLNKQVGYNPECALDFTGTKFFLLEVVDFNNNSPKVLLYNTLYNSSDILAKIPNVSTMTTIIYEDSSDRIFKTRKYFGPIKLQKLTIRLLDEYGKVIDMNNADISVTFELESLDVPYKKMVH